MERFRQNISLPYVQSRLSYTSSAGINGSGGAGRGILAIAGRGRSSSLGNPVSVPLVRPSGHGLTTCAGRPGQLSQAGRLNTPVYRRRIRNQAATSTGKKFTKSVILVNYGEKEVPRGKRRQTLQKAGAIIDLVDFYTDWSEEKVREVIESALRGILDSSQPQPRLVQDFGSLNNLYM